MPKVFVDVTKVTGTYTPEWSFTNGSSNVTATGDYTTEVSVGHYIRTDATPPTVSAQEWYKVTGVSYDAATDTTTITLDHAFFQETHTATISYNAEDGTSVAKAFCHLNQATTDEVRAPGDIIFMRRGQTHYYSRTIFADEDGTVDNPITLKGDDGTGWPAEKGADKPIIDFQNAGAQMDFYGDFWWRFEDFEVRNAIHARGHLYTSFAHLKNIKIVGGDRTNSNVRGFYTSSAYPIKVESCEVTNCYYGMVYGYLEFLQDIWIHDCEIATHVLSLTSPQAFARNLVLGETPDGIASPNGRDLYLSSFFRCRNVLLASSVEYASLTAPARVYLEDYDQLSGANKQIFRHGIIVSETAVVRPGGGPTSLKVEPNSYCGKGFPLPFFSLFPYSFYLTAGTHTISVYIRGENWTYPPAADECWIEVEYRADATSPDYSVARSTQSVVNDNWVEFSVTFSTAVDGPVLLRGFLAKYETDTTRRIYVDTKPVVV